MTVAVAGVPWWQRGAVSQVHPRSFADSDGDGVGDLRGLRARLDHLADLSVPAVWLSPVYRSPRMTVVVHPWTAAGPDARSRSATG